MLKDVLVDGVSLRVNYSSIPDRPTLIFLHDSLGCIKLWRDFPERLAELTNCGVLIYDRQGYGDSAPFGEEERRVNYLEIEADTLHDLLSQLDLQNVVLFGHSDGGSIALIAAAKYPKRISAMITEGAHIFVEEITLQGIRDAVETYHTTDLKAKLEKYHGDKTEGVFRAWTQTWLSEAYQSWNIESFLPQITCPVLVIQGEKDEFGSLKQVDGLISRVSGGAESLIIPGVGHSPHKEAMMEVMEKATRFIQQL